MKKFTQFLGRSPDTASAEDLRRYQLHRVEQGISSGNLNTNITGLKFFVETTLDRPELTKKLRHVHAPRKIPLILSVEEVTRLLQSAGGPKYQAALGVAYGAGLRAKEVVHLSVNDIDSEQTQIAYHSCRNRHCPKCQASAARRWLEARQADLLPVDYYHLVFTLPSPISALAYYNKSVIYSLLFQTAAETLLTIAADPKHLGARIGWPSPTASHRVG